MICIAQLLRIGLIDAEGIRGITILMWGRVPDGPELVWRNGPRLNKYSPHRCVKGLVLRIFPPSFSGWTHFLTYLAVSPTNCSG